MRRSAKVLLVLLAASPLCGCFSYTIFLAMHPDERMEPDVEAVVVTVSDVARRFKFTPNPNLDRLRRQSEESDYWWYRVVADYLRYDKGTGYATIIVTVAVHKETGQVAVQIRDLDHGSRTDFTRELETALRTALAARFPSDEIEVKEKRGGPHIFAP
jgi:hypothetical protein